MKVNITIKNSQVITDIFLKKIIESIDKDETNGFYLKLHFDASMDSSKLIIMEHEGKEIKLTRYGENDDALRIEGERDDLIQFMQTLLVHGTIVLSSELCSGLFLDETLIRFRKIIKDDLWNMMTNAFTACQTPETED